MYIIAVLPNRKLQKPLRLNKYQLKSIGDNGLTTLGRIKKTVKLLFLSFPFAYKNIIKV